MTYGMHKSSPVISWGVEVIPLVKCRTCWPWRDSPVSVVIMHVWYVGLRGRSREIVCKVYVRPLSLQQAFFCAVETLLFGEELHLSGICGLVGPDILVLWSWIRRSIFWL